ncbi:MAG: hypothetical protein JO352_35015 [Chloroflexi bacterium]|nr:hypothetical protein [Chloroflexota bacterium]MBV9597661.1 hypothetical protein [Chloroflexota bacterium]
MTEPAVDIHALLRAIVEQQTALLGAHTESLRLQRTLLERVLGSNALPVPLSTGAVTASVARPPLLESASGTAPTPGVPVPDAPLLVPAQLATAGSDTEPLPTVEPAPPAAEGGEQPISAPRSPVSPRSRSDRYYQAHTRQTEQPTPRPTSLASLDVLRRIQATGEVAHLVLTFGPHAGEPLGQVVQIDPDYLRELARTAQRPDVRAAAARLIDALPSPPPPHSRRTSPRWRRGPWRDAR